MSGEKAAASGPYLSLAGCLALSAMGPLSGLAQSALGPILPQITAHFADEPNAGVLVRLMISGLTAAMIVGALASGFLAERIGELRLLLICLATYVVAGVAGFVLNDLYLMVASRFVLGVANSAASGLALALITTEVAPASRDRWVGFFVVTGTVGVVVLMGVVGVLGAYDWRYVFLLYLLALPIALAIALTFPVRDKAARAAARAVAAEDAGGRGVPWAKMLLAMLIGAGGTTVFMYLPYHLAAIGQGRPEQLAPVMMMSTALGSLGSAAYGWVRRYFSVVPLFSGPLLLAAVGLLILVASHERALVFVGIAIFGGAFGLLMPHMFSSFAAATPAIYRPRMLGFVRASFYGGPLLAQVGLELVNGRYGPAAAVAGISVLAALGALAALVLRKAFVPVEEAAARS